MWHKATPLFTRNIFDRIAVVNNHWSHYPVIQRIESGGYMPGISKSVAPLINPYLLL